MAVLVVAEVQGQTQQGYDGMFTVLAGALKARAGTVPAADGGFDAGLGAGHAVGGVRLVARHRQHGGGINPLVL